MLEEHLSRRDFSMRACVALSIGLCCCVIASAVPAAAANRPPAVLFTDVSTGPTTGGVYGVGAPIAIFGTGFGETRGTSTVTIGGVEVASYLVWGSRNAHNSTLDLIVVEPGPAVGGGLVVVTVDGHASASTASFTPVEGRVFVIAPSGDDSGECLVDTPCRTIGHVANDVLEPGDVLLVRGGEYDESEVWLRDEYGDSGTAAAPKVIARYPGEEPIFSNAARPFILEANHIVVSGLRFTNGKSLGIGRTERGRLGNRVVDCTFEGRIAWAAIALSGDDHTLAGNVCRVSGSEVGTEGHCYYVSFGRGVRLLHNIGTGAPGYGIHVFDQRRQANDFKRTIGDLLIDGNILTGSTERSGMILAMGDEDDLGNTIDGVVVRNNLFVGNNHAGLVINGNVHNVQVLNNTFYRNGRQGLHVVSDPTVSSVTVQNNVFDQTQNDSCSQYCSWFEDAQVQIGGLAKSVSVARNYYAPAVRVIGAFDASPVTDAVTFADPVTYDFRPLAGSAVVDAGLAVDQVPIDHAGLPRPQGRGIDIGAFEYVSDEIAQGEARNHLRVGSN